MLTPAIELRAVVKAYGGLRPLRIDRLEVSPGERVIVQGLDEAAAAVLIDLVTATTLPDSGEVRVGGQPTAGIADHEAWLAFLDHFGIVNARVVLLDDLTVLQNLAVPLTLDLDPLPSDARSRAEELAAHVGLVPSVLDQRLAGASPMTRLRVRVGRAVALDPGVLLVEHPTLVLPGGDGAEAARVLDAAARPARTLVVVSSDDGLAGGLDGRCLAWTPATGVLKERRRGWWRGP